MYQQAKEILFMIPAFAGYYLFTTKVINISQAEGNSMHPTLKDGELLIVQKTKFQLQKDDIIIARSPLKPSMAICKRIRFLENEFDPYGNKVPPNHIWIEGDNASVSFDSRQHGPIPINLVEGRVIY